eukprot:scaffold49346_cov16-Prasinocladus_malaysianus.AAC.4
MLDVEEASCNHLSERRIDTIGDASVREQAHCDKEATFKKVELQRRTANIKACGREMVFISHCWRNPVVQDKKRRIIAHLSTPKEVRLGWKPFDNQRHEE